MRLSRWFALFCLLSSSVCAQVVINEFVYDDTGADDREFIELFNAGQTPIAPFSLTIENRDTGGVSVMNVLVCPQVPIPPGGFYLLGNAAVVGAQQIIPINSLENDEEVIVLRDVATGIVLDSATYETNRRELNFPINLIEGAGIWGNHTSTDGIPQSWSRFRDGYDTGNNGRDFGNLPATPGASNVPTGVTLPYFQNFDSFGAETPLPGWSGSFVPAFVIDPTVSGPVGPGGAHNPGVIPASPQGGNCMVVMDPTGGGDVAILAGPAVAEILVEAWVYFAATNGTLTTDFETWSIGVRGSSGSFHNHPAPFPNQGTQVSANGNTGAAWEYVVSPAGATLRLRDEGDGGQDDITIATIPITAGLNDGWQRLRLSCRSNLIEGEFGGTVGVPGSGQSFSARTGFTAIGSLYIGYRENLGTNQSMRPVTIDDLRVTVPLIEYQRPRAEAELTVNQVQGTGYEPAITEVCSGQPVTVKVGTSLTSPPFDAALTLSPLLPLSGGGLISPAGQIINIDLLSPSLFFLNGITTPLFLPLAPFELAFPAPPIPFIVSMQAVVIDPMNPDGVSISQGVHLRTVSAQTEPCALEASGWSSVAPQVTEFAVQFYDTLSGAAQPLVWINNPTFVSAFTTSIDTSGGPQDPIPYAYALNVVVKTGAGDLFRLSLSDVAVGLPGTAHFLNSTLPTLPSLHTAIENAYGITGFASNAEKKKEKQAPAAAAVDFKEEELIPKPNKTGPFTSITLIIYQDNHGEDFLKKYAENKAAATGGEAFKANGINSIVNKLRSLYGQCKLVSCLIIACHGAPGVFRIGPEGTPFGSPTHVGLHEGQTSPGAFGQALQCYLAPGASIKQLACSVALTENATTGNGSKAIQDLADQSCVDVTAADDLVIYRKNPPPNPNCLRKPITKGNVWRAQKNNPPPVIITPAPVPPAVTCMDP